MLQAISAFDAHVCAYRSRGHKPTCDGTPIQTASGVLHGGFPLSDSNAVGDFIGIRR